MKRIIVIIVAVGMAGFSIEFFRQMGVLHRKNSEGNVLGRLGALRSALSIYYGDLEGQYPHDLDALVPRYLAQIEPAIRGMAAAYSPHDMVKEVQYMTSEEYRAGKFTDKGGWAYVRSGAKDSIGTITVNCTHTDNRGRAWTSF